MTDLEDFTREYVAAIERREERLYGPRAAVSNPIDVKALRDPEVLAEATIYLNQLLKIERGKK